MIEVEIKDSPIHGKGVFAKEDANPGELVGVYEGPIVWKSEDMNDDNPYVLWLEDEAGRWYGINGTGEMRHLNHEEENPNALLATNSPYIYVARPIKAGDEITIFYSEETDFEDDGDDTKSEV